MDGRLIIGRLGIGWLLAVALMAAVAPAGCNRREGGDSAAAPPSQAPTTADAVAQTADAPSQPDIPPPWPPAEPVEPSVAGADTAPVLPSDMPLEAMPDRAPTDLAFNPLRGDYVPQPEAVGPQPELPPRDNPLRTADSTPPTLAAPRMMARAAPRAFAPLEEPAAGDQPLWPATESVPAPPAIPQVLPESLPISLPETDARAPNGATEPPPAIAFSMAADLPAEQSPQSPAKTTPADQQFQIVQVFYGTDRMAIEPPAENWASRLVRFLPTGCVALIALCLTAVAAGRRHMALGLLAIGAIAVALGLGFHATAKTIASLRVEGKEGPRYTSDRSPGGRVDLGMCEVTIPLSHRVGEVESPSILRLEVREDAARHVTLRKTERLVDERFYELLRQRVQASPAKELFIFIHGFNVSFEDAARRTAQIHHDLEFAGAPVFFSWPANSQFVLTYPADETNVAWSAPHLKQFLLEITQESGAESVNLIAHSMGNRALAAALREIELELRDEAKLFNQVILAAPDLDADDFRYHIAPSMQRTAHRLTLYASSRDDALLASHLVHRGPRAGDAGRGLVVVPGIDTIDVTAIDSSPWGHAYYGSSDPVLQDLRMLLTRALAPQERTWLSPAERDGLTYWIFQPLRTATSGSPPSR